MRERSTPDEPESLAAHAGFLRSLARGLLFDRSAADDVAQKALLIALQKPVVRNTWRKDPRDGTPAFSLRGWLAGVVRNLARERGREDARRAERERAGASPEALPSAADTVARLEMVQRVVAALHGLEEPYRTTVVLRFLDGLKPGAIAKRMGVPVETVRTRIKRALAQLRVELDARHGGDRAAWGLLLLPTAFPAGGGFFGAATGVAWRALAVGGLGALAMSTKLKLAIGATAAVVAAALLVNGIGRDDSDARAVEIGSAPARSSEPADAASPPAGSSAPASAPAETTTATRTAESNRAPSDPSLTFVIHGRTLLPDGKPRGGLRLEFACFDGYDTSGEPRDKIVLASDSSGSIAWPMRPPSGTVTIVATSKEKDYLPLRQELLVLSGEAPGRLDLTLRPFDSEIFGRVLDERDEPIPGAHVRGWTTDGEATCDERGHYVLRACASYGQAMLSAWADDRAEAQATAQIPGPGQRVEVDFHLRPGLLVRGTIRDVNGAPVQGARVSSSGWYSAATSGSDGRYALGSVSPVQPQEWLRVTCPGFAATGATLSTSGGELERDFTLHRGARVEGRVVDAAGQPVRAARVWVGEMHHSFDMQRTLSRDDGSFAFDHVGPGPRRLGCEKKGLPNAEIGIEVAPDRDTLSGLLLEIGEGHWLAGVVVDRDGAPVAGANVMYCSNVSSFDGYAVSGEDGAFRIDAMGAGPYTIRIARGGFLMHEEPSGPLDRDDARFVLERAGGLAGRVVDVETGEPVKSFRIRFVEPRVEPGEARGSGWESTWSDPGRNFVTRDGTWRCEGEGMAIGSVLGVEVTAAGYAATIAPRCVVSGTLDPDALVLRLGHGTRVAGEVRDEDGRPVEGAIVRLESAADQRNPWSTRNDDARWQARSGAGGGFEIEAAPAGTWQLVVDHPGFALHRDGPFEVAASGAGPRRTIRLDRGGVIEGVVLDASGRPRGGGDVLCFFAPESGTGVIPSQQVTDELGRFRFDRLPRGVHQVSLQARHARQSVNELSARVRIDGSEPVALVLQPRGDAALRGRIGGDATVEGPFSVHLQWLGPLDGGDRAAEPDEGLLSHRGVIAIERDFAVESLEAGRWFVSVSRWDDGPRVYWSGTAEVRVEPGATAEVTVRVERSN